MHGVIGVAGSLTVDDVADGIVAAWRGLDLPGSPDIVPDVLVAYAAGTTAPNGAVVVAGTGSIAAAIRDRDVRWHIGGYGWLLGDEGSAVWLGLQATRLALSSLDGRSAETVLSAAIPEALGVDASDATEIRQRIVRAAHGRPPARIGRLAPVVLDAAASGDAVAVALVGSAVEHLVDLAAAVVGDPELPVIVLAGSLLTRAPLIEGPVRSRLAGRWPAACVTSAASGEAGAVALAISRSTGTSLDDATLARIRDAAS
jgi:N-acetylglucosamine kinase-like BadF-type ATPase